MEWATGDAAMFAEVFLAVVAALSVYMFAFWLASLALRNVSIVDIAWGLAFVLVAWTARLTAGNANPRNTLQVVLVTLWGLRLCLYLLNRNWGKDEDYRYAAMRRRVGPSYAWKSIYLAFGLQGVLVLIVSLPVQAVQGLPSAAPLGFLDAVALAMFAIGFFFEAIGDYQLTRFKANPENDGKVMDLGVWAWTRHPNYFGDALQWWAFGLFAVSVPGAAWTLVGPALMTFLLLRISGVHLLERGLRKRKPDYEAYAARTPSFIPRPPRRTVT
jgi:steroid 5-alpha reductase family enzyme